MGIKEDEEYRRKCLKPFREKTQKIMLMSGEKKINHFKNMM